MDTVYIETTVVGNLAGRMHPDPLIASRQTVTRKWWATARQVYCLLVSELVIDEFTPARYSLILTKFGLNPLCEKNDLVAYLEVNR